MAHLRLFESVAAAARSFGRTSVATGMGVILAAALQAGAASAQPAPGAAIPTFDIWAVELGRPLAQLPFHDIAFAACGTNGGPPAMILDDLANYKSCRAEKTGLREVYFEYDDEQAYIARALRLEWEVVLAGTTMYGRPIIPSLLVDDAGIVRGIRVVTDDRIRFVPDDLSPDDVRAAAVLLAASLRGRFSQWELACEQIPLGDGQTPVGTKFVHDLCRGENAALGERLVIDAHYFRRTGQVGIDIHTRLQTSGAFESTTRFELLQLPYATTTVHDLN